MGQQYRRDIDGLRALSVSLVVIYHAFPAVVPGGFVGVDVFFVISGYLISSIIFRELEAGNFSFGAFYARRIRRIFPSLVLLLGAIYAIGWTTMLPTDFEQLGKHIAGAAGFSSNFLLWREAGYFDAASETKPLLHLWSLGIEEQFYVVFPIAVVVLWRRKVHLPTAVLVTAVASFVLAQSVLRSDQVAAFYSPAARFWELLVGVLLAVRPDRGSPEVRPGSFVAAAAAVYRTLSRVRNGPLSDVTGAAGLALVVAAAFLYDRSTPYPGAAALVPVTGAALVIAAGPRAWTNRFLLANRLAVAIGLVSYPLYLWHWPLLVFGRSARPEFSGLGVEPVAILLSLVLAFLSYRFVERPIRSGAVRPSVAAWTLAGGMAAAGLVGFVTLGEKGIEWRFPPEVADLTSNIDFHWADYIRFEKCHLQDPQLVRHDPLCYETKRPLIALWGDSHASSLYPGLKKLQDSNSFGLLQLTQAGCGPIFNLEVLYYRQNCNIVNIVAVQDLIAAKPDLLIMHASWVHFHYPLTIDQLRDKLTITLGILRQQLPETTIVVIGPVPVWDVSPQKSSYEAWTAQLVKTEPVSRMLPAHVPRDVEAALAAVARDAGVIYLSAISELCDDADRCLTRVGDTAQDFVAIDMAHLSKAGAEYLVSRLGNRILGLLPEASPEGRQVSAQ